MEVSVILNKPRNLGLKYICIMMKLMYEFKPELNFGLKFNFFYTANSVTGG